MYSLEFDSFNSISGNWDVSFVGTHSDERDIATKKFLESKTKNHHIIHYDAEELCLDIDKIQVQVHELHEWLKVYKGKKIILDATSMDVAELYIIAKAIHKLKVLDFEIIYTEPLDYPKTITDKYILSESGIGFAAGGIPSLTIPTEENRHVVFLLGYEGERFADAMEVLQLKSEQVTLIIGVPSYKLNWEKNTYNGNLKVILDNQLNDRYIFCGANNPISVNREIQQLKTVYNRLETQFCIVPIGTKPMAIGCLKAICEQNEDNAHNILWDHPVRKSNRTIGVSKITITKRFFN